MIFASLLAMMSAVAALKTPETSACFEKFTDLVSGVVSYLLKPGLAGHNQQSLYYTQKAMTDDGRFLVFVVSPDETEEKYFQRQHLAVLDFLTDTITVLDDFRAGTTTPYLDVKTDELFYLDRYSEDRSLWKRSLLGDMRKPVKVCAFPEAAAKLGKKIGSLYTHLTRTADGKGFFLDLQIRVKDAPKKEDREMLSVLGVLDAGTGVFTEWYRNPYTVRHAAANPRRADIALALEPYWETHKEVHDCGKTGICKRLLLLSPGKSELIVGQVPLGGKPPVHVVHTEWTADGSGIYWCSYDNGVILHNIDTGHEEVLMKENRAVHCEMTDDNRYIVFDQSAGPRQFRGQSWKVGFYDRVTKRTHWIYTKSPELMTPEKPSGLHPDPHPNFAMNDRYAICTMNVKERQLSVLVTPTGPLKAATSVSCGRVERTATGVRFVRNGETVWNFELDTDDGKPYVHPLRTPSGLTLTDVRPDDHPWHKGLWFSWKFINGANFWETPDKCGSGGAGRTVLDAKDVSVSGLGAKVEFTRTFRSPTAEALMTERCAVDFLPPDEVGGYAIVSEHEFTALKDVALDRTPPYQRMNGAWAGGYAGLAMRMSADAASRFSQRKDAKGVVEFVCPENGESVLFHADEEPKSAKFYAWPDRRLLNLSPIYEGPLTLKAGEQLRLRYVVQLKGGKKLDVMGPRLVSQKSRFFLIYFP